MIPVLHTRNKTKARPLQQNSTTQQSNPFSLIYIYIKKKNKTEATPATTSIPHAQQQHRLCPLLHHHLCLSGPHPCSPTTLAVTPDICYVTVLGFSIASSMLKQLRFVETNVCRGKSSETAKSARAATNARAEAWRSKI